MSNSDRVIEEALKAEGLCGCGPFRADFLTWLGSTDPGYRYPLEIPYDQSKPPGKRGMSLCSRVTEMFWCRAGLALPKGMAPPWDGQTFVRTHTWPASHGALGDLWMLPNEGCACWTAGHFVGCFLKWADPWDISLGYQDVTTIEAGQTCRLKDGGHEGRGLQAILRKRRRYWPDTGRGAWIQEVDPATGKLVGLKSQMLGWIDVDRLPR
jgi:hypothetical protein